MWRDLIGLMNQYTPGSLDELARITGKAKSNLSRMLRTMEGYGLLHLERGERGRITPKVMHDRVHPVISKSILRASLTRLEASRISSEIRFPCSS